MNTSKNIHLDGATLSVDHLVHAAQNHSQVEIFPEQAARVKASRDLLDGFVKSGRIIYGVTTAVGGFVNWLIPEDLAEKLQSNILRGVASNVGPDLDDIYVRAAMLCRINSLGRGISAISLENFKKYNGDINNICLLSVCKYLIYYDVFHCDESINFISFS